METRAIYLLLHYTDKYQYTVEGVYSSMKNAKKGAAYIVKKRGLKTKIFKWYLNSDYYLNCKITFK